MQTEGKLKNKHQAPLNASAGPAPRMMPLQLMTRTIVLLILVSMTIAISRFQPEDTLTVAPEQIEIYLDQDWRMIKIGADQIAETIPEDRDSILAQIDLMLKDNDDQEIALPYTGTAAANDIVVFCTTLPAVYSGQTMHFTSTDTNVRVILDGAVIYQYRLGTAKSYGPHENAIYLPVLGQDSALWIELTSPYPDTAFLDGIVSIRAQEVMMIGLIGNSIADIACCLVIMIMAVILSVLALIRCCTHQPIRGELFLSVFGLVAGVYCFIATDTLSIFYDIQEAYVVQEFFQLLLPLFLARYLGQILHNSFPHRFSVLFAYTWINAALQIFLQLFRICDLKDLETLSSICMCIVCLTALDSLVRYHRRYAHPPILFLALPIFFLLAGETTDLIGDLTQDGARTHIAVQYGTTLFMTAITALHTLQLSKEYRKNAEASARLLQERVSMIEQQNLKLAYAKKDADAARQDAQTANEAKGRFLAQMSHEIRTPINAILGMDEMILRESNERPIKEYAMDIYLAGQTLLSLINDILDLSKIDSGKMEIVPITYDLSSLIHDLANMTSQRASAKGLKLEIDADPQIPCQLYGDDVRIRQVLTNILTNAVKYTPEGTVWLRVRCETAHDTALLTFEVEDTGIGIKSEDLPKLCAEFERIEEGRNRDIEGTGLGMSITIRILSLLNSHLHVESTYGKGSRFSFQIEQKIIDATPIGDLSARVHQIIQEHTYSALFDAPDARILVVDDNAVNRRVFCNLLKQTHIQVTDAESGAQCLDLVQKEHYDLIFLDHMMPEMDGVETLHQLKALPDHLCKDTPVIILTANAVSGAREAYLSEGFDDFLSKPIVPEKLEHLIQKLLPQELLRQCRADAPKGSPEDPLEGLPQIEGLDWRYAWSHLQDRPLLEDTVRQFYAQIMPAADTLEELYIQCKGSGTFEAYRIQVHTMKGLAATVGILPLSGLAQVLEQAARKDDLDTISALTAIFLDEWRSYHQKLQVCSGISEAAKKEVEDPSIILALIEIVRLGMLDMDIDKADQAIAQLQSYRYPDEIGHNIQKLARSVTDLDLGSTDHLADLLTEQIGT